MSLTEIPWFSEPPNARLSTTGNLWFVSPEGEKVCVPVDSIDHGDREDNVWHIVVDGDIATVSPSIHFVGHFHSPNPVVFKLVNEL